MLNEICKNEMVNYLIKIKRDSTVRIFIFNSLLLIIVANIIMYIHITIYNSESFIGYTITILFIVVIRYCISSIYSSIFLVQN